MDPIASSRTLQEDSLMQRPFGWFDRLTNLTQGPFAFIQNLSHNGLMTRDL